ncbi:hypothetical protein QL285_062703 [Trifolium repens]|nr:hypothetical protein QL285_062703 [Trifolium repens]
MGKTFGCSIIPAVVYPYCEVLFLTCWVAWNEIPRREAKFSSYFQVKQLALRSVLVETCRKVLLCPGTTCLIWSILIDNSSTDVLILNPDGGTQLRPVTNSLGQGLQGCVFVDLCVDNEPFLSIIQLTKETELWIDMPRMVASLVVILYCLGWCLWHH